MNTACAIDPSYGYNDLIVDPANYINRPKFVDIESNLNYNGNVITTTTRTDETDVIITSTAPIYTTENLTVTIPDNYWPNNEIMISAPIKTERTIKNISVLKCKCCDAKLDADKMKNNIIKCEYCDYDNYIDME